VDCCCSDGASSDTASYELEQQPLQAAVAVSPNVCGGDNDSCDEPVGHVIANVADQPLTNFVSTTELADEAGMDAEKPVPATSDAASAANHQHTVNRSNSHVSLLSDNV